ncbi:MAG: hypothetical protein GX589_08295 [Deltaproteobacteria bacterium]|nr:hypothetical protein [Deltaproteobacteria bacterium]
MACCFPEFTLPKEGFLQRNMRPVTEPEALRYYSNYFSVPLLAACALIEFGVLISLVLFEATFGRFLVGGLILFFWTLVYCVRVVVDLDRVCLSYGIGLFQRCLNLSSIESVQIVPNRFVSSWIYTPMTSHVVLVYLRGGGRRIIPADNPRELVRVMNVRA